MRESQGLQYLPSGLLSFAVNSCQDVTRNESMTIGEHLNFNTADLGTWHLIVKGVVAQKPGTKG